MSGSINSIRPFTIKNLFESHDNYVIPIYQRNYAWGTGEIKQLVQDIKDYVKKGSPYYIGTLVVAEKEIDGEHIYETNDGQQRLTTLIIYFYPLVVEDSHRALVLTLKLFHPLQKLSAWNRKALLL